MYHGQDDVIRVQVPLPMGISFKTLIDQASEKNGRVIYHTIVDGCRASSNIALTGLVEKGMEILAVNERSLACMNHHDVAQLMQSEATCRLTLIKYDSVVAEQERARVEQERDLLRAPEKPQPYAAFAAKPTKKGSKTGSKKASKKAASASAFAVGAVVSVEGYACNGTVRFVGPHHEGKGERVRILGS